MSIARLDGVEAILDALRLHESSAGVTKQACGALRSLAANGEARALVAVRSIRPDAPAYTCARSGQQSVHRATGRRGGFVGRAATSRFERRRGEAGLWSSLERGSERCGGAACTEVPDGLMDAFVCGRSGQQGVHREAWRRGNVARRAAPSRLECRGGEAGVRGPLESGSERYGVLRCSSRTCRLRRQMNAAENKVLIARLGGVEAVLGALRRHASNAGVVELACGALSNVAVSGEALARPSALSHGCTCVSTQRTPRCRSRVRVAWRWCWACCAVTRRLPV